MKVLLRNPRRELEMSGPRRVHALLAKLELNRESHLVICNGTLVPGDAIAFNFRTLHAAPGNAAATPRRVFSARWVGGDAVFAKRSGTTSPPFRELAFEDGAPFDAPIFPVVHRP